MSVELRVTSKGEGILILVGTKVIDWVRGNKSDISYLKTCRAFDVLIHSGKPNAVG